MRRVFLIFLVLLNVATPTFAGSCAVHCAGNMGNASSGPAADADAIDCHGQPSSDFDDSDTPDDPGTGLMQAACAVAATASLVSVWAGIERPVGSDRIDSLSISPASWLTSPPDHPPRTSSV